MSLALRTYVIVQAGDTLAAIAERYKTTVATIARLNDLAKEASLTPGSTLQVPQRPPEPSPKLPAPRPRTPRYAFAVTTGPEGVYPGSQKALVREGQDSLSGIYPLWFQVSPQEPWRLQSFATDEQIRETVQTARERNLLVLPILSNHYYTGGVSGREVVHHAMTTYRQQLLTSIEELCHYYQLDGLMLDWADVHLSDRDVLTAWLQALGHRCRTHNRLLAVNVPIIPNRHQQPSIPVYDLQAVGQAADFVCLSVSIEPRTDTPLGPIASLPWVEACLTYALRSGLSAHQTLLVLAGYAYDWKGSGYAPDRLSFEGAMHRARQYRVNVQFDRGSQTPMYRYQDSSGHEHQVWFENTSSFAQKIGLINRYQLAGLVLWRLGLEDPGLWHLLRARWGSIRKWRTSLHNSSYDK